MNGDTLAQVGIFLAIVAVISVILAVLRKAIIEWARRLKF